MIRPSARTMSTSVIDHLPQGRDDGVDVGGRDVVMIAGAAVGGLAVDGKREAERRQRAQHHADLGASLAVLDRHEPLPADAGPRSKLTLAESELAAAVAKDETEVEGGANMHGATSIVVERRQYSNVAERRQVPLSPINDGGVGAVQGSPK